MKPKRGEAPYPIGDLPGWFDQIREYLRAIVDLCQLDTEREAFVLSDLIQHATEHPMYLCNEGIRVLRHAYPDDESFAIFHYPEEEEDRREEERQKKAEAERSDPVRRDEANKAGLFVFMENLKAADFDVVSIVKDHLAGTPKPIEEYKGNGKKKGLARKEARA